MPVFLSEVLQAALAITLLWSGAAKLGSIRGLSEAVAGLFRVSAGVARTAARLFSSVEVAAAILLVVVPTSPYATALSFAVGASILAVASYAAGSGRVYSCGCFGSRSAKPLGWRNAAYGGLIAGAALTLLLRSPQAGFDSPSSTIARSCVVAVVLLVAVLVIHAKALQQPIANFNFRRA